MNQKNYEYLFNEFKALEKNIEIDIVGEGPLKSKLVDLANKNKLKINFWEISITINYLKSTKITNFTFFLHCTKATLKHFWKQWVQVVLF